RAGRGRPRDGPARRAAAHEAPGPRAEREGRARRARDRQAPLRRRDGRRQRQLRADRPPLRSRLGALADDHREPRHLHRARGPVRPRGRRGGGAARTAVGAARADRRGGEVTRVAAPGEDRRAQALVRDSGGEGLMRLYFATDLHGSETCWRKFLNAGHHYKADVIVLGGDMTGKALVPVIDDGGGRWHATLLEHRQELTGEDQVVEFEQAVIRRGYYPFRIDPDELRELSQDEP